MKIQKMECGPIKNGNVILVEPNCININNEIVNGIPQYQDMHIFAELTAKSRGRTVIVDGNTNNPYNTSTKTINFIGNNQDNEDPNNPNYLNFTTNYYDGSTGGKTHYEGFGIDNIKIVINSSFIPQVNIRFIDVRGLAFFNQTDSPYRILFDFPPPIFTLTVKGYYGKPLTYKLHLVKYTSEFNATNGNFIIDAQFVALTFAPLSDILFRYVVNAPLINNEVSMNPEPGVKPSNTFELILKLKTLYAAVAKKLETDAENQKYQNMLIDLEKIDLTFEILKNYKENETLKSAGKPYLITRTKQQNDSLYIFPVTDSVPQDTLKPLNDLSEYDKIIKTNASSGIGAKIKERLYVVFLVATNVKQENNTEPTPLFETQPTYFEFDTENDSNFENPLLNYKDQLLSEEISSVLFDDKDIVTPESFFNAYNIQTGVVAKNPNTLVSTEGYVKYYGMDISGFYQKLYKRKSEIEEQKNGLSLDIARKINAMVAERLGMIPSIYNIFEIILNDVDTFFGKIKSVSNEAIKVHNNPLNNKRIIMGDNSYSEKKGENTDIYPFPLVIDTLHNREERVAPIELSKQVRFPEMELVYNFMDTFMIQNRYAKQINSRENQNDDGTYKWIPISPFDSKLGGATPESPYLGINDNVRNGTLNIILQRFYMLTQGTIPEAFYPELSGKKKVVNQNKIRSDAYLNLYSKAEAINLESTLTTEKNAQTLKVMADEYGNNINKFYSDISELTTTYYSETGTKVGSLYDFPQYDPAYFLISSSSQSEGRVYTDKTNPNFEGINITSEDIQIQTLSENSNNPVDNFPAETRISGFFGQNKSISENYFDFTEQNLLYLWDKTLDKTANVVDFGGEIITYTRYIVDLDYKYHEPGYLKNGVLREGETTDSDYYPGWEDNGLTDAEREQIAYVQGNESFKEVVNSEGKQLDYGGDIIKVWSDQLGRYDEHIIDDITGTTQLSSIIVLSNFGFSLGPFNKFPNLLNSLVFDTPSAIQVPKYYAAYVGALITAEEDGWMSDVTNFFTGATEGGNYLDNRGFFVLADAHDVNNYLSVKDKEEFKTAYQTYMTITHGNVVDGIKELYNWVRTSPSSSPSFSDNDIWRTIIYNYLLNPNVKPSDITKVIKGDKGMYFSIIADLMERETIVNYSQITFMKSNTVPPYPSGYTSIKTLNEVGGSVKQYNDNYFINLFTKLSGLITTTKKKLKEEEEELKKVKGDKDIINQLYYSFKNINDKWLTGTPAGKMNYPFSKSNESKLIDSFAFVDRGMNPIGETILNAEILGQMLDDPNISLFSVITQLLSLNGFEFFPLQNFLSFESENSWEESFKIHTGGYDDNQNPFFVCMYIGGSSSYPSVSANGFENDGILNIAAPGVKGFSGDDSGSQYDENENQEKTDFKFREVRAFRVRFGEQNQSMFTDIKIDSKEYPETNESIQILSRLAGDQNPDAPVPKGQNLYNLYENRSYKATVTGFGNAMIQPTQYFQLENIPLFNGAYIILTVEHNITANKMTTSFSGTKLLKYPMPRVLTPVAFTSYDGLSGGDAVRAALNVAPQAKMITPERLEYLKSELGIDISHHNGNADWKKTKAAGITTAFIKLTQGTKTYSGNKRGYNINKQVNDAISNGVTLGYYHFAEFGTTASPTADGVNQANWFTSKLNLFPTTTQRINLPAVLDIEGGESWQSPYLWTNKTTDLNIFIKSFVDTMKANGYETMIYSGKYFIDYHQIKNQSNYPLWMPNYMNITAGINPEVNLPPVPNGWWDWDVWQFTSQGIVDGVPPAGIVDATGVDLNVVKKEFLNRFLT